MDLETKKLVEELGTAFEQFKKANDAELKILKEKGHVPEDLKTKTDKLNDEVGKIQSKIDSIQTALNRGGQGGEDHQEKSAAFQKKYSQELRAYMSKGTGLTPEMMAEAKAMSVDSDENGGFWVGPQLSNEIVMKVFESSPVRSVASVQTISTDAMEIMEDLDEAGSGWVGETSPRPETTTPKIKMIKIPVHELSAQPAANQKFLDDAAINVESWLAGKVSEKFARDEATAFVRGNGVAKPMGFLSYPNGTGFGQIEQIETAGSVAITADDMIDLDYSLKGEYKRNAVWMAPRLVQKIFRKFKDLDGQYLWQPGLNGLAQATLLGKPLIEANDLDANSGTLAAGLLPVAFGDFRTGYQIVDRVGIRVLRDPFTSKPNILFYTTKRVGGAVKNYEAIKLLKIKA